MEISTDPEVKLQVRGESYYLTTLRETDIPALHAILSEPSVNNRLFRVPKPYTIEMATEWAIDRVKSNTSLLAIPTLEARTVALFAQTHAVPLQVIRTSAGQYIGCASLTPRPSFSEQRVELGYYLDPAYHGKGIMAEAAKAVIRWAKAEFGVEKVHGSVDCTNYGSGRVMETVVRETARGAVKEGVEWYEWPPEKAVEGREERSISRTRDWDV